TSLVGVLGDEGFDVSTAGSGEEGLGLVANSAFDAVLLDVWMPGIDGLETLKRIKQILPEQLVVIMSGHGNIETAVRATKLGAYDFIEKPLSLEKLLVTLRNALRFSELDTENRRLRSEVATQSRMIGSSAKMMQLREQIATVAPLNSWVLITGENGTGKELIARAIHAGSKRSTEPLVAVNCAAIPEELIESELFGHEKGAFTGAVAQKKGRFDLANGGTIFLDEIADMSLKTQAKVLRILQDQCFERVGGRQTIKVDVRVLAATNKSLPEAIKSGQFREDLYYRLNVIPVVAPPLRERAEDIPDLLRYYFEHFAREAGKAPKKLSGDTLQILKDYSWPGNIRELKNLVERLSILARAAEIAPEDLPAEILDYVASHSFPAAAQQPVIADSTGLKEAKALFEREFIIRKLKENGWNVSRTAQALDIERAHLHRKIKAFKISDADET
ncbi:MAG: sigma-54-dependent Fis family transcriptional regulator, partial [Bdellovibrionales bacterium]|nr:sigma-54-dependent Fis family transcriptional regulator [Bdellovibrionales bacterium]